MRDYLGHSFIISFRFTRIFRFGFLVKKFPHVLGCDMAGIVEAVGPEVTTLHVGDHVWGYTKLGTPGTGTFAEYCVAPAKQLGKVRICLR